MQIKIIVCGDELWQPTIEYANKCSWKAGRFLANQMLKKEFLDWERVFVAVEKDTIAGYCTLAKKDCIPDVIYTPYIGYMFVGEEYRGNRLSEKLILSAIAYARELNFNKVYLVSDHVDFYEKYGFVKVDEKKDLWGNDEKIYMHLT